MYSWAYSLYFTRNGNAIVVIFLHEVTKLLDYAGCTDVKFIRIGTSGGIGVEGGTVVSTENAINAKLEMSYTKSMLGQDYTFFNPFRWIISKESLGFKCRYKNGDR